MARDPRIPIDELGRIAERINRLQDQLDRLSAPSGTSAFQTVNKLQGLINNIQAQLDDYIANGTYNKAQIDAKIASPGNIAPGTGTFSGFLRADAGIASTNVRNTIVTTGRAAVWVDSSGRLGVSA